MGDHIWGKKHYKNKRNWGGMQREGVGMHLSTLSFKVTFKWHRKLCGWHREAGIRLLTPEASTGSCSNEDHTHNELYNVTHDT